MTDDATPFDMFTMAPRNKREFRQAISHQAVACEEQSANEGRPEGFGVPYAYIMEAVGFMSPSRCLDLLYQSAPPDRFRVWYDARFDNFVIEPYWQPKAVEKPSRHSGLILPGHA